MDKILFAMCVISSPNAMKLCRSTWTFTTERIRIVKIVISSLIGKENWLHTGVRANPRSSHVICVVRRVPLKMLLGNTDRFIFVT